MSSSTALLKSNYTKNILPIKKIVLFGGGAFSTALSLALSRKCPNCQINVWHINKDEADAIETTRENKIYFKGFTIPPNVHFTSDCIKAITSFKKKQQQGDDSVAADDDNDQDENQIDLLICAIPVQFMDGFFKKYGSALPTNVPIILASKGICMKSLRFPYEIANDALPHIEQRKNLCVFAGPSFAKEIAENSIVAVAIGAESIHLARHVQRLMSSYDGRLRLYATTDFIGQEVAAATKNVYAILSGAAAGFGLGASTRAALLTRSVKEIGRVMRAKGSNGASLGGLAGIGDLFMTASSELSRNFTVGYRLGKGEDYFKQIKPSMKAVAEGVPTAKSLHLIAQKLGLKHKLPLANAVYKLIYEGGKIEDLVNEIILKPLSDELRGFPLPQQEQQSKL